MRLPIAPPVFVAPGFGLAPVTPRRGFTLVELLVAIGIVAVLLAILIPAGNMALEKSRAARCMANLRQLGVGIIRFAAEHNGTVPPSKTWRVDQQGNEIEGSDVWYRDSSMWPYTHVIDNWPSLTKIFRCPSDKTVSKKASYHSYTWSHYFLIYWRGGLPRPSFKAYVKLWDVQSKILMLDGTTPADADPNYTGDAVTGPGALLTGKGDGTIAKRHQGAANCLYGDGSVRLVNQRELIDNPKLWGG